MFLSIVYYFLVNFLNALQLNLSKFVFHTESFRKILEMTSGAYILIPIESYNNRLNPYSLALEKKRLKVLKLQWFSKSTFFTDKLCLISNSRRISNKLL